MPKFIWKNTFVRFVTWIKVTLWSSSVGLVYFLYPPCFQLPLKWGEMILVGGGMEFFYLWDSEEKGSVLRVKDMRKNTGCLLGHISEERLAHGIGQLWRFQWKAICTARHIKDLIWEKLQAQHDCLTTEIVDYGVEAMSKKQNKKKKVWILAVQFAKRLFAAFCICLFKDGRMFQIQKQHRKRKCSRSLFPFRPSSVVFCYKYLNMQVK